MALFVIILVAVVLGIIVMRAFFKAANESPVRDSRSWRHEDKGNVSESTLDRLAREKPSGEPTGRSLH